MAVLVLATSAFVAQQLDALRTLAPGEAVYTDPETAPAEDIEAIIAFRMQQGVAGRFPNLRFIACAGAGADEILALPDMPDVPIVRPVDPLQSQRIAQYTTLMVLRFHRDLPRLEALHREGRWQRALPRDERQTRVGVLGFGESGRSIARALSALGFPVRAWRRSQAGAHDAGVEVLAGNESLPRLLASSDVLVCALPLTPATRGLIDRRALRRLPRGAFVVDVSRGGVLDHDALLECVDDSHLAGAALDVFAREPLPDTSALWKHPRILCTPHVAGTPRGEVAAAQFLENLRRSRSGEPLVNVIDRARGY
ncbi:MAG TPA: glyoxylate/hydroxypyruvate reductase A [Casimicrobiaceae bacterium]|nr:glyoxylate/hydroxypyruvate reductase A [Casimicrobiaceae bacterium]